MGILTESQKHTLNILSQVDLFRDNFYLTGGTALSEFYLQHRYSEDLDFFTPQENISPFMDEIIKKFSSENISFEIVRRYGSLAEMRVIYPNETIKMDLAFDSPIRLLPVVFNKEFQINIDNETDITCNKLSALFDRTDPKDFVDIYFIHHELISLETLIPLAKKKHVGMDDYYLARAFFTAYNIQKLPRMIKEIELETLKTFFIKEAEKLLNS